MFKSSVKLNHFALIMSLLNLVCFHFPFFSFVGNWNNFYTPYVLLTNDNLYNLPVGLAALISSSGALNGSAAGSALPINRPEVALAGLLVVLPIAVVFLFSQRYLQTGLLAGAEKG